MTFVQLEYVVAVDTYRHFATAADHCFVTQPTLSMQVQKLEEELGEMREAMKSGNTENMQEEFGDLMFVLVNFARMNGIDAETALRDCSDKFERRFRGIENHLKNDKRTVKDAPLEEMERLWTLEKLKEKK